MNVHVLARRRDTNEILQETVVNPTTSLTWSFASLPAGEYVFLASIDVDGDGVYFEDGDWTGAFPIESDPEVVLVLANTEVTSVEFPVAAHHTLGGP